MKRFIRTLAFVFSFFVNINTINSVDYIYNPAFDGNGYFFSNSISFVNNDNSYYKVLSFQNLMNIGLYLNNNHQISLEVPFSFNLYTQKSEDNYIYDSFFNINTIAFCYQYFLNFDTFKVIPLFKIFIPTNYNIASSGNSSDALYNVSEINRKSLVATNSVKTDFALTFSIQNDPLVLCFTPNLDYSIYNSETNFSFSGINFSFETVLYFLVNSSMDLCSKGQIQVGLLKTSDAYQISESISFGLDYMLNNMSRFECLVNIYFLDSKVIPGFTINYTFIGKLKKL